MLFTYTAEHSDELSITVGEVLEVVSKDTEEGYWEVSSVCVFLREDTIAYTTVVCIMCLSFELYLNYTPLNQKFYFIQRN